MYSDKDRINYRVKPIIKYSAKFISQTTKAELYELINQEYLDKFSCSIREEFDKRYIPFYPNQLSLRFWIPKSQVIYYGNQILETKHPRKGFLCYRGIEVNEFLKTVPTADYKRLI